MLYVSNGNELLFGFHENAFHFTADHNDFDTNYQSTTATNVTASGDADEYNEIVIDGTLLDWMNSNPQGDINNDFQINVLDMLNLENIPNLLIYGKKGSGKKLVLYHILNHRCGCC